MSIKHNYTATGTNDGAKQVSVDRWNEAHQIDGQVDFPLVTTPTTPSPDNIGLLGRKVGGRMMMAQIGPSGLDTSLQPLLARNKVAWAQPNGNSTAISYMGLALTATGTATTANVAATNIHTVIRRIEYAVTTASTTAVAGFRSTAAQFFLGPLGGFFSVCRFGPSRGVASNATRRGFIGFTSNTAAPTDVDVSSSATWANLIGVGHDAADTNYQIMVRTGTSATTKIDTGIAKAATDTTEMYELALFSPPGGSYVGYEFTRLSDGASFSGTVSSNLPTAGTLLTYNAFNSVGGTSSVIGISLASLYIETDY